jgi:ornithine carbamoyltransferase
LSRHFLTGAELAPDELRGLVERGLELKGDPAASHALRGRQVAMLFEKPSTRTRLSFETGVVELGGHPVVLRADELQLARGESPRDTALVLARHVHAVGVRSGDHAVVEELAGHSEIPVINLLTPRHHPCQALADLLTLREEFGRLDGLRLAYVGDGNNVCHSLMVACARLGADFVAATPPGYRPDERIVEAAREDGSVEVTDDPRAAAEGADVLYTDVWTSMGQEAERERRLADLLGYGIDDEALRLAADDAIVLHCLPAHYGEEITEDVLYGPQSAVWDEAENRLHAQKALLALVVS